MFTRFLLKLSYWPSFVKELSPNWNLWPSWNANPIMFTRQMWQTNDRSNLGGVKKVSPHKSIHSSPCDDCTIISYWSITTGVQAANTHYRKWAENIDMQLLTKHTWELTFYKTTCTYMHCNEPSKTLHFLFWISIHFIYIFLGLLTPCIELALD